MANIIVPDSGEGSIDRELLRDKFTGRSNLFFNQNNAGGVRSARTQLNYQPEVLQLDPAVKYRAFSSQTAANDFLDTGLIAGRGNYGGSLYFNQGVPLFSYAQTQVPNQRFILATLGEGWGDRHATTFGKKGYEGGLRLEPKDIAAFQLQSEAPLSLSSPYLTKVGDLPAPDTEKFKRLKEIKKFVKDAHLKMSGKKAGIEKGQPRPLVSGDVRITDADFANSVSPTLESARAELKRIGNHLIQPESMKVIKQLLQYHHDNPTQPIHPILQYYGDFWGKIEDGHLRGYQDQVVKTKFLKNIPKWTGDPRDIYDDSPANLAKLKKELETAIDAFVDSSVSQQKIVPFDKVLSYFPENPYSGSTTPNPFGTFSDYSPKELEYIAKQKYRNPKQWPQHIAGLINHPDITAGGVDGLAFTRRIEPLLELLDATTRTYDPSKFATTFAPTASDITHIPLQGGFEQGNYGDGAIKGGEYLGRNAQPLVPNTQQEGLYIEVPSQINPTLTTPLGTNLLRLTPRDEPLFSSPQGVLQNLNGVFDNTLSSWGKQKRISNLDIPTMGLGGAMYSEVLPTTELIGNYLDPETNQPRKWQALAPFINPQEGHRPAVLFQIMDDGSYKVLKQYNNEPTSEGWTPIPTKTLSQEKQKEAYVRYLQEMTKDVAGGRSELTGLKPEIFSEIYPELPTGLTPEQMPAAYGNLTEEQLGNAAARLMARGISPSQIIDPKYSNYDDYLPSNSEYRRLGGLIDEATRGNPQYGRKGFISNDLLMHPVRSFANVAKYLGEKDQFLDIMKAGLSNPETAFQFAKNYAGKVGVRGMVNQELLNSAGTMLTKAGTVAAVGMTPFDAVHRRDTNLDALVNSGLSPEEIQRYAMPVAIGSGLEPAANIGTMGLYDQFSPSPSAAQARRSNIETLLNIATRVALTPLEIRRWLQESGNESK